MVFLRSGQSLEREENYPGIAVLWQFYSRSSVSGNITPRIVFLCGAALRVTDWREVFQCVDRRLHRGAIVLPGSSAGCLAAVGSATLCVTFL